jgi:hypothetical protein
MQRYDVQPLGFRTPAGDSASDSVAATNKVRIGALAGVGSEGLVDAGGAAPSSSLQYGTRSTDPGGEVSCTTTPAELEGAGTGAEALVTEADGSQSVGYGRIRWDASDKSLTLFHRKEDALVSSNPRVQYYAQHWPAASGYMRMFLQFHLGTPSIPWIAHQLVSGNSLLIWQLKADSDNPTLTLDVTNASNGDTTKRDIWLMRRLLPADDSSVFLKIRNVDVGYGYLHSIILDVGLDWRTVDQGGRPYVACWYNGLQQEFEAGGVVSRDPTLFADPTDTNLAVPRSMVGLYRYTYTSVKAPDDCGIVVRTWRHEQTMDGPPPLHTGGVELFDGLTIAQERELAAARGARA